MKKYTLILNCLVPKYWKTVLKNIFKKDLIIRNIHRLKYQVLLPCNKKKINKVKELYFISDLFEI